MSTTEVEERPAQASPVPGLRDLPILLRRNATLVPADSAGSRALVAVIAILTFLAALCAGAAELVASGSAQWSRSVAQEVTVQVRPSPSRDIEADVARAAALTRATPGIADAQAFSKAQSERVLEPWLGAGLDLTDLPVPRLIVVRLVPGRQPDLTGLRQRLAAEIPGATLDDHSLWLSRLSAMAGTIVALGIGLVLLVLTATGLAVAFATRGAMAGNREVVEVLHFVGADDAFIAGEFQRRFLRLGLEGGLIGGAAALAFTAALGLLAGSWRASPQGDQIEALFGSFEIGWTGYGIVVLIALAVSAVAGLVSRITVRRYLKGAS